MKKLKIPRDVSAWIIMLPSLVLFAFFVWEPLIESIRISLYHSNGMTIIDFAGLQNYIDVIKHPVFWITVKNTVGYTLWSLIIGFFTPMIIASLITETTFLKSFFRVGVYFPNIIPGLAAVLIWRFFFGPGENGVLNILLGKFGIERFSWLTTPGWTIPLIVVTMTWKFAGNTALIYMARIGSISADLYEAAAIDGATPFQRYWHVTLPSVLSLGKTLLILQIISVFQILYEPLMMTNGGPNNASMSIMQLVYRYAFNDFNYPRAAALSVLICILLVVLTAIYFRVTKNVDNTDS